LGDFFEEHRSKLTDLCRQYRVRLLEAFGSVANGTFDPNQSDLDFLVDFEPMLPGEHSRSYFDLWFALQDLFGRNVDLVESGALTNPYFVDSIRASRRPLYAV